MQKELPWEFVRKKSSGTGLKEKLCLDIYTLYAFNEGSISALPKNMLKSDSKQTTEHIKVCTISFERPEASP